MSEVPGNEPNANTPPAGNEPPAAPPAPVVDVNLDTPPANDPPAADPPPATVDYEPTGDVGLDVALAFVGKLGIGRDHPAMQATATGDFGLIKAHLATMGDKATGWEQMVALAEASYDRQTKATAETQKAVSAAVIAVAGSAETWNAVKAWASANADPDEKQMVNAMFNAGPVQARAAAMMLMDAYTKASGTVVAPKSAVRSDASTSAAPTNGPLDAKGYAAAARALHAKLGTRMEGSAEYAALRQRFKPA